MQTIKALSNQVHSLRQSDRDALISASSRLKTHATVGTLVGLTLGLVLAARVRSARKQLFTAFRTVEKPTHIAFADGRQEALPDMTPYMKPSPLGDLAAYFFFGAGGLFLGGETGLLTGSLRANSVISSDPDSRARIERAFRRFRADMLRKQAEMLDRGEGSVDQPLLTSE